MGSFVLPKVYLVGYTQADLTGIYRYLEDTKQEEFARDMADAMADKVSGGEILCSLFAKLCYKSLVTGKNANISKTRPIENNLKATYDSAHGSVFEHVGFNFIVTDCSRVFTHELVRHRVGTAFSQTSGRYCRLENIDLVLDPILDDCKDLVEKHLEFTEGIVREMEIRKGLRRGDGSLDNTGDFDYKKKVTSAIRRIAPNGQSNEIAFTVNIRSLRHLIQLRTAPAAEWEIRYIMAQVYDQINARHPLIFYKAKTKMVDGLPYVYGMRLQPYEIEANDPAALCLWDKDKIEAEIFDRVHNRGRTD